MRQGAFLSVTGLIAFFLAVTCTAYADTHSAASCNQSDVAAAISAASSGDTVSVPACPSGVTWSSPVTLNKQVTLQGAGIGQTVINASSSFSLASMLFDVSGAGNFRITGFTLNGNSRCQGVYVHGYGRVSPPTARFRIDHNKFTYCVNRSVQIDADAYGVIDNNQFYNGAISDVCVYRADYSNGDDSWGEPTALGTDAAVYIESNTFTVDSGHTTYGGEPWNHAITSNHGARYVFRYNTITISVQLSTVPDPLDAHGNYDYGRGTRTYETYNNTLNIASTNVYRLYDIRGGTGVVFNNTWDSGSGDNVHMRNANTSCSYPCTDQVGRGQNQALEPLYVWGNTNDTIINDTSSLIQVNRDYYIMQKPGYTAYTYPHPLTTGSSGTKKLSPPSVRQP